MENEASSFHATGRAMFVSFTESLWQKPGSATCDQRQQFISMKPNAHSAKVPPGAANCHISPIRFAVQMPLGEVTLAGDLEIPLDAEGLVLFAHGSGSSRHSPRNHAVARVLRSAGCGTLLFDLLTREEETEDAYTGHLRFDIRFLAKRLGAATHWARARMETLQLPIGYFGSSTGGAAALVAAAEPGSEVRAVVSRGGRPDLAGEALPHVQAPTLLIVGACDDIVLELNERAFAKLRCESDLAIIPGATHLFEEPGTLDEVAALAAQWFQRHWARKS